MSHLHNQCGKAAAGVVVQVVEEEPWVWAASAVPKAGSSGLVMDWTLQIRHTGLALPLGRSLLWLQIFALIKVMKSGALNGLGNAINMVPIITWISLTHHQASTTTILSLLLSDALVTCATDTTRCQSVIDETVERLARC